MNKAIVLPSQRFVISRIHWGCVGGHITRVNADGAGMKIHKDDLLPMARALIEIYEGIEAEKEEYRERQAREGGEPVKGT